MGYSYPEIKTFKGLYLQKNSFTVPDGAMELARNCILLQDNRVSKTPGVYEYFAPGSGTLNNLFYYQTHLISAYADKLAYYTDTGSYPNETGSETALTGATVAITSPRVSRSAQASSNLYFTTDNGVLKLDAYNAKIFQAGVAPGLDIRGILTADNGWFTGDSQAAYRVVFGRRDANANLLLGAPSEQLVLTNSPVSNVAYTVSGAGPYTVTVTSTAHNLSTGMTISVTASTGAPALVNGDYTVTVINANSFSFSSASTAGAGNLTYDVSRTVQLEFTVPSEISDASDMYFFQIYRTTTSLSAATTPTPNYRLVEERILTSAELTARRVFYTDDVDEVLVFNAPELYTNPNSREGELQANVKPPKCDDLTLFKNCLIYAKCTTRHVLALDVIDAGTLANGDYIETKVDATTRRYVARTGVGNLNVPSSSLAYSTPTLTITYTSHGLINGDTVYISNAVGTGTLPSGSYTVSGITANTFDITQAGIVSITYLEFQGVTNASGYYIFQLDNTSTSVATQLRSTAQGLIKAINRDTSSLIYGFYASSLTDVPGKMQFQAIGFGGAVYVRANTTTAGSSFQPALPDSFVSGNQVYSQNEDKPNSLFAAKVGENEATPIENEFVAGSRNAKIFRAFALRDSVIILKGDGVFRLTGDSPLNFSVTAVDSTIFCVSANSAVLLNNQVYFLSNQGVCVVTETSAQILSREKVEDVILPILGKPNLEVETGAVGFESQRTYRLSTIGPNDDVKSVSYIYNFLNDSWTTQDTLFNSGVVGTGDALYVTTYDNKIYKERKTQTRIDYCGQNYDVTAVSVASNKLSGVVTSVNVTPEVGDIIVKSEVITRIASVVSLGANNYALTFRSQTNLAAADAQILYKAYETEIDFAPFHAGQVGLMKQYSQLQIHTRTPNVTRLTITFSGYSYGGSETTEWVNTNVSAGNLGWGLFPWGFEPWGQSDTIDIQQGTKPAPPIRLYIPRFQQRNTYIKTKLVHKEAGESIDIQAMTFAVRPYKERVSK